MTRTIFTKNGDRVLVDDMDFDLVAHIKWHINGNGYVVSTQKAYRGSAARVFMHRRLMGLRTGDSRHVDHRNGDKLDNRRVANLRVCTNAENQRNRGAQENNSCGYKGVSFHKARSKWRAVINVSGNQKHLGIFDSPELAHEFYCLAADLLHGEFANHGRA